MVIDKEYVKIILKLIKSKLNLTKKLKELSNTAATKLVESIKSKHQDISILDTDILTKRAGMFICLVQPLLLVLLLLYSIIYLIYLNHHPLYNHIYTYNIINQICLAEPPSSI